MDFLEDRKNIWQCLKDRDVRLHGVMVNERDKKYVDLTAKVKSEEDGYNQLQQGGCKLQVLFPQQPKHFLPKPTAGQSMQSDCFDCAHQVCLDSDQLFYHLNGIKCRHWINACLFVYCTWSDLFFYLLARSVLPLISNLRSALLKMKIYGILAAQSEGIQVCSCVGLYCGKTRTGYMHLCASGRLLELFSNTWP